MSKIKQNFDFLHELYSSESGFELLRIIGGYSIKEGKVDKIYVDKVLVPSSNGMSLADLTIAFKIANYNKDRFATDIIEAIEKHISGKTAPTSPIDKPEIFGEYIDLNNSAA